jgi:hypothetical protein
MPNAAEKCWTPPRLGRRWCCDPGTIIAMLKRGELHGFVVGKGRRRPRWRITPEAVAAFEQRRLATPTPAKRRRARQANVVQYF